LIRSLIFRKRLNSTSSGSSSLIASAWSELLPTAFTRLPHLWFVFGSTHSLSSAELAIHYLSMKCFSECGPFFKQKRTGTKSRNKRRSAGQQLHLGENHSLQYLPHVPQDELSPMKKPPLHPGPSSSSHSSSKSAPKAQSNPKALDLGHEKSLLRVRRPLQQRVDQAQISPTTMTRQVNLRVHCCGTVRLLR